MEGDGDMNQFRWIEIVFYLMPFLLVGIINRYFKHYLKFFKKWPLTLAIVLLPLWLALIYAFGWLIFDYNMVPYILFLTAFMLGLHLYDHIRRINEFSYQTYYRPASQLVFVSLSAFLVGLMVLRLITYFT